MLSNNIKELIEPHLLFMLHEEDRKYIDDMCSEMYLIINEDGREAVALKPLPQDNSEKITPLFSPLNGAFLGVSTNWDEVKRRGKRL